MIMANTKKKAAKKTGAKVSTTKAVAPEAAPEVDATEAPAEDGSQLTIADLQALASVIDIAVRRGAFGAGEVTEVGAIFDKLSSFLAVIAAQKEAAEAAQAGK
jgi:hypothetical protein